MGKPTQFSELQLTDFDRVQGIAPQLLDICQARVTLLAKSLLTPGKSPTETELIRGRAAEVLDLIKALETKLGRNKRPDFIQSPSGAET